MYQALRMVGELSNLFPSVYPIIHHVRHLGPVQVVRSWIWEIQVPWFQKDFVPV